MPNLNIDCPKCGGQLTVPYSVAQASVVEIERPHECEHCKEEIHIDSLEDLCQADYDGMLQDSMYERQRDRELGL